MARRPLPEPSATVGRLTSSADIREVFAARTTAGRDHVVVHARARADGDQVSRIAVVAGRRVGGAVVRNRAKRRLRACLPEVAVPRGVDLVVTAKVGADEVAFDLLCGEVGSAISSASHRLATRP